MKKRKNISDELIFKVLNNESSEAENKTFQEWVDNSNENKKLFIQLEKLWQKSNGVDNYYKINQTEAWESISQRISQKSKHRIFPQLLKVAAVIAVAYLLGVFTMYLQQPKAEIEAIASNDIMVKVPLGSKTEIHLSDGTKVWLNSGSEFRYPSHFDQDKRDVYLVGEAYFDVEKDETAPFFVHANEINIKVLGTRFNVKSYPEDGLIETTLEEGLIDIFRNGSNQVVHLEPNQKATFVKKEGEILVSDYSLERLEKLEPKTRKEQFVITENIDIEPHTSWKYERIVFKREKFGALMVKLERWHHVHITIENNKLIEERVTGIFETESIEQVMEALKISVPFTYEIDKNNIIIK